MRTAPPEMRWTLDQVHALPEDGNRHERVHGELWVTPGPAEQHDDIVFAKYESIRPFESC